MLVRKIIHLVDNLTRLNLGIWHAALVNSELYAAEGIKHECWSLHPYEEEIKAVKGVIFRYLANPVTEAKKWIDIIDRSNETCFISHGSWQFPTKVGAYAKSLGFRWVAVPHGMLEPWSMQHKAWKKTPYFYMREKPLLKKADAIRAVAPKELENLRKDFEKVTYVPNPIHPFAGEILKADNKLMVVFLGRMHQKKNPFELAMSWGLSTLKNRLDAEMLFVGPDEGETEKIKKWIGDNDINNISLVGPLYGEDKAKMLVKSHAFFLPSKSEGFPTTVLEAMTHAVVPYISSECNMDFMKEDGVVFHSGKTVEEIIVALESLATHFFQKKNQFNKVGQKAKGYADSQFGVKQVFKQELELYLGKKS